MLFTLTRSNGRVYPFKHNYRFNYMLKEYYQKAGKSLEDPDLHDVAYFGMYAGAKADDTPIDFKMEDIFEWCSDDERFFKDLQHVVEEMYKPVIEKMKAEMANALGEEKKTLNRSQRRKSEKSAKKSPMATSA